MTTHLNQKQVILNFFNDRKNQILDIIKSHFKLQLEQPNINPDWTANTFQKIADFTAGGKMIRGGLVCLSYLLYKNEDVPAVYQVGAAIELIQTAFLIQDDIMDRDPLRRGMPTLYRQYQDFAKEQKIKDSLHFGESMAICASDIALFTAYYILSAIKMKQSYFQTMQQLFSTEFSNVSTAQMIDLYHGSIKQKITGQDIINLYIYKTARYTFSLPLMCGAMIAEQSQQNIQQLSELGQNLGIIFQIHDDEIGLTGDEQTIGKQIGSDIREGKKTLFYIYLYHKCNSAEIKTLDQIFGNKQITETDINQVIQLINKYDIIRQVNHKKIEYKNKAEDLIKQINIHNHQYKDYLLNLLNYNLNRNK